jgi:hypothetical protein
MENQSKQLVEYVLVKEIPMEFLENSYVGRVYLLFSPVRLVFTLDFDGTENRLNPINQGFEFFSADPEIDRPDIYDDIVDELCGGFLCYGEEEQEIRTDAEEFALEIVEALSLLVE